MFNNFFSKIVPLMRCEKNVVERGKPKIRIRRMCIECQIPKATNTYTEYALLIAFPLQQWLQESESILRYTYIVCLVIVVGVDVAAITTKVFTVSKERQKWVPFALLASYKILRSTINNDKCFCLSYQVGESHLFCAVVRCYLRPVRLCHIFSHWLINGTIFRKELLNIKYAFWFSNKCLYETFFIKYSF